jgi:large subunit ribosomal protein L10
MPNNKNKQTVEELRQKIQKAKSIILADYRGLSADDINKLRADIKDKGAETTVAKNTLLKVALEEEKIDVGEISEDLKGPTAAIFSYEDSITPIKTLFDFAKNLELPKIKSAIIDGVYNDSEKLEEISKIPSKEELLARLVSSLKSPLSGIANTLGGVQKNFVYTINAIKTQKEEGGAK